MLAPSSASCHPASLSSLCSCSGLSLRGCLCGKAECGHRSTVRNMVSHTDLSNMFCYRMQGTPHMVSLWCRIRHTLHFSAGRVALCMLPCVALHSGIVFVAAGDSRRVRQNCFGCAPSFCRVWCARLASLCACCLPASCLPLRSRTQHGEHRCLRAQHPLPQSPDMQWQHLRELLPHAEVVRPLLQLPQPSPSPQASWQTQGPVIQRSPQDQPRWITCAAFGDTS